MLTCIAFAGFGSIPFLLLSVSSSGGERLAAVCKGNRSSLTHYVHKHAWLRYQGMAAGIQAVTQHVAMVI